MITSVCRSQVNESSDLFKILKTKDSLLFNIGFNECELQIQEELMGEDLEFYHDQGGVTLSRNANIESMKKGLCKTGENKYLRELVIGSLEVYPLKDNGKIYGAIQMGIHRFYLKKNGKKGNFESIARFIHVWILENGNWILKRIFSYDHSGKDYISN
jgi:hypothetical protein